jgi:hypothetical protein
MDEVNAFLDKYENRYLESLEKEIINNAFTCSRLKISVVQ